LTDFPGLIMFHALRWRTGQPEHWTGFREPCTEALGTDTVRGEIQKPPPAGTWDGAIGTTDRADRAGRRN
jgi:hypothetical protein